jgi:hypothetical protein
VAENVAVVEPAGTVTDAGIDKLELLSDSATDAPVLGAAALRVTVQVELPGVVINPGLHETELRVTGIEVTGTVTVPPVPKSVRAVPVGSTADVFVTPMAVTGAGLTVAIVRLTTATTPFAIVFAFIPEARQV